ncbi:TetR family transcriptional regulator [Micromonospora sp. NPDC048898]|uniref:TetR/AcrR family transcriptional regulator n=1 Tax=Micromonospora sp. NPDC048898 TaxID=3364260 RepID=UPI0037228F40
MGASPGPGVDRRERIRLAAVDLFAERGFRGTTIRAIADRAEVDPALVMHHYGAKDRIFSLVIRESMRPESFLPDVLAGSEEKLGRAFLRAFLVRWEDPAIRPLLLGVFRSSMEHADASRMFREVVSGEVLLPLAVRLSAPDSHLRAALVGTLVVGLVTARYVVCASPIAELALDDVVGLFGDYVDQMLSGKPAVDGAGDDAPAG